MNKLLYPQPLLSMNELSMNKYVSFALIVSLLPLLPSCATKDWYEVIQRAAQQRCQQQPETAREECERRLNKEDYESYERNRKRS